MPPLRVRLSDPSMPSADPVALRPAKPGDRVAAGPVLAADPALVADLVEQVEEVRVIDLADIRLVPARRAGDLDMRVQTGQFRDRRRQIAAHDLHVIEVELEPQI